MRPTLTEKFLVSKEKGKNEKGNVKAKKEVYTNNIFDNDIQLSIWSKIGIKVNPRWLSPFQYQGHCNTSVFPKLLDEISNKQQNVFERE